MRTKRLLAATAAAAGACLLVASPASASEETVGSCTVGVIAELGGAAAVTEAIEAGEADGASVEATEEHHHIEETLEGCLEAPNPILPETNEIIWGGLAFLVLFIAMVRYGYPMVQKAMADRTEQIRSDLEAADTAKAEAEELKRQREAELANVKAESAGLIDEARQEATRVKADLQSRAEADIAEMRERANAEVATARQRAMADLQGDVAEIVVGAASRVVERNLDVDTQRGLIDEYIASVGNGR